ncbi:MAG: polyprenyl synthetase family protein [Mycobacteriaceae bacterium]|nr:polyprenyl synthetase family protein [Mycobacteriaceae bacterium]
MLSTGHRTALSLAPPVESVVGSTTAVGDPAWPVAVRQAALAAVADFVTARRAADFDGVGLEAAGDILLEFVSSGKCLRSTFMYVGWLCGAEPDSAALSAAASLELLHAFALLQDDVMDQSQERRGRLAVHVQLAQWYQSRGLSGPAERFGESAAILLSDLCLVWAEQMLRESGVEARRLHAIWPRYDAMRTELAIGQFADLTNDVRDMPSLQTVLDVARRKSGNYTVRRPLEIGAAMADCDDRTLTQLGCYGGDLGEAFQLRDDILGVFGSPAITGKPNGGDLIERKATSVVVAAYEMADATTRHQLDELIHGDGLDETALHRFRSLILVTGADQRIEEMISERVCRVRNILHDMEIDESARGALGNLADACVARSA